MAAWEKSDQTETEERLIRISRAESQSARGGESQTNFREQEDLFFGRCGSNAHWSICSRTSFGTEGNEITKWL